MSDITDKRGRKFTVLIIVTVLWCVNFFGIIALAIMDHEVPISLGISLGTLTSCFPGYLGVNTWQKKIQGGQMVTASTEAS